MRHAAFTAALMAGFAAAATAQPAGHDVAASLAHRWLAAAAHPGGLIDSQADGRDICYTYDQAVSALAMLSLGDTARAGAILDRLAALQDGAGAWVTAFTGQGRVAEAARWVGPVFWVCLAAARYRKVTGSTRHDGMARAALAWCLRFRQPDGSIRGGLDAGGDLLAYASVEENQDAFAAFRAFGMEAEAIQVRGFLISQAWDAGASRWRVGPGRNEDFLDVNSWGFQSLGEEGPPGHAKALDYNLARMRLTGSADGIAVDGFDFNGDKDDVWLEGTAQMAAALKTAGRAGEALHFLDEIIKAQKPDGGIAYSLAGGTTGDGWNMPRVAAASSAGWFILAVRGENPFRPERVAVRIRPLPATARPPGPGSFPGLLALPRHRLPVSGRLPWRSPSLPGRPQAGPGDPAPSR